MYSNVVRSDDYKSQLLNFIRREYGVDATGIYPAKRGWYGETWRMDAAEQSYFAKLVYAPAHKSIYANSFSVIDHMNRHSIDFISRITKTTDGRLYTNFDGAVLGMFDWIEGENRQDEITKVIEYQLLAKVYTVPVEGLVLLHEDFTTGSADLFLDQWESLPPDAPIRTILEQRRAKIEHRVKRLRLFSERCRSDVSPRFITHGDAGGNFVASGDKNYIVDWDTPILAPPERDAWFCMSWDWAMDAFHNALRQNGIDYTLQQNRLAYYCYHMFFFYLNAYLDSFVQTGYTEGLEEYMDGWIEESFQYADKI